MKTILILALGFVLCGQAWSGGDALIMAITSRYKGDIYESAVRTEQFNKMPTWSAIRTQPVPLSPEKAIQAACSVFEKHVPEQERSDWILTHVELRCYNPYTPKKAYSEMAEQRYCPANHIYRRAAFCANMIRERSNGSWTR